MRNVFAVLTLVVVLVSLAAFAGCSQASKGANETMKITLDGDDLTGSFMASRVPSSGFSRRPTERVSESVKERCAKDCAWKFDSCKNQRDITSCRMDYDTCYNSC